MVRPIPRLAPVTSTLRGSPTPPPKKSVAHGAPPGATVPAGPSRRWVHRRTGSPRGFVRVPQRRLAPGFARARAELGSGGAEEEGRRARGAVDHLGARPGLRGPRPPPEDLPRPDGHPRHRLPRDGPHLGAHPPVGLARARARRGRPAL